MVTIRKLSPEEVEQYFPTVVKTPGLVNPGLDQPVLDAGHSYECLNKPGGGLGTCVCGLNYRNAGMMLDSNTKRQ
jgi:hypothetical protein